MTASPPLDRGQPLREVLLATSAVTLVTALLYRAPSGFLHDNLHAFVAAMLLGVPQLVLRRRGDIERYGFRAAPVGLGLFISFSAIVIVFPFFTIGLLALLRAGCARWPAWAAANVSCVHIRAPLWRLPEKPLLLVASQLVVVALPEELFFRGFVQGRLEERWPPTVRLLGAPVGVAWLVAALIFGLGHYLVSFEPQMLTRFFPGLVFGWMFARTRSILPGTIFHAACNVLMEFLSTSCFT